MSAIARGAALVLGRAAGAYATVAVLFVAIAPHSAIFWLGEVRWHRRAGRLLPMDALDLDFDSAMKQLGPHLPVAVMTYRTKRFDAALLDAVQNGARQVVVLGAGFDSRAYRFQSQLGDVRVMEVDYGPTQAYKKQRLGQILQVIPSNVSIRALAAAGVVLLLAASLVGILGDDGGSPYAFTSLRGQSVEIYGGTGVHRHDSVSKAMLFRGFDWANLFVGVPLLAWGAVLERRGRLTGQLLLSSVFAYLAYNYLIGVMGNAFNSLFLVWTGLFSVGVFGLAFALAGIDLPAVPAQMASSVPRRTLSVYMGILGLFLLVQYLSQVVTAYRTGSPPASLGIYTTLELAALELAIMVPLHATGAILLWRKRPLGYLLGAILVFTAFVTFTSLAVGALISHVAHGRGSVRDVAIPVVLAVVAGGFSAAVFTLVGSQRAQETPSNERMRATELSAASGETAVPPHARAGLERGRRCAAGPSTKAASQVGK